MTVERPRVGESHPRVVRGEVVVNTKISFKKDEFILLKGKEISRFAKITDCIDEAGNSLVAENPVDRKTAVGEKICLRVCFSGKIFSEDLINCENEGYSQFSGFSKLPRDLQKVMTD